MERLLGKVKAQKLAYETKYKRMQAEAQGYEDDIEKYQRYIERSSGSQARMFTSRMDEAKEKLDSLKTNLSIVEKQYNVLSATLSKLENDMECVPGSAYAGAEELRKMADMAQALQDLDNDPELEALMNKYS